MTEAQRKRAARGDKPFLGQKHTAKTRKKMRGERPGFVPWNKGRPWTEAEKLKISLARKSAP